MKYIYVLLLILAGSPVLASVYATADAAKVGIERGRPLDASKDGFVRCVGYLKIEDKDTSAAEDFNNANAILISSNKILTCAHAFKIYTPTSVAVIFYPSFIEFHERYRSDMEDGTAYKAAPGKSILDSYAMLDLTTIQFHPTLDIAMINLKSDMPHIPRLPLLLAKPDSLPAGYLVSYGEVTSLDVSKALTPVERQGKRHISILAVKENTVPDGKGASQLYWTKEWHVPAGVDATDPRNKIFTASAADHRLTAFSQPGDSGAPFLLKNGKNLLVAGVYKGKSILFEGEGAAAASTGGASGAASAGAGGAAAGAAGSVERTVLSLITPLYLAADWIESNI